MRNTTNIFLSNLCLCSFISLLGLLVNSTIYQLTFNNNHPYSIFCLIAFFYPISYPIINTFQMACIMLTVCVSVNQFLCIYHSRIKNYSKMSTRAEIKKSVKIISFVYVFSIIYCIPYWFKFKYSDCSVDLTEIGANFKFNQIVNFWMYLPIAYLIPFTVLIVTNSYLVFKLMVAKRRRKHLCIITKKSLNSKMMKTNDSQGIFKFYTPSELKSQINRKYSTVSISSETCQTYGTSSKKEQFPKIEINFNIKNAKLGRTKVTINEFTSIYERIDEIQRCHGAISPEMVLPILDKKSKNVKLKIRVKSFEEFKSLIGEWPSDAFKAGVKAKSIVPNLKVVILNINRKIKINRNSEWTRELEKKYCLHSVKRIYDHENKPSNKLMAQCNTISSFIWLLKNGIKLLNGEKFISTNLDILAKKPEHENQECSIKKAELIIENKLSNFISKIESLEETTNKQKSSFKFIQQNIANMKSALECTHESVNQLTLDIDSVNQRTEKIFSSTLEIKKDILDSNLKLNEEISKIHNLFLTNGT
ncbi:unnamed protein product [Brachionus calyciflorus]|uniref:G-protein coupled receptors family 1 profile domain-containing protein n=1 Tax=Brachionus calyciflorus TaxID=104777 RepID=A0A813SJR8_9BILA|nr:unnamed protein product [Brachionus calyciflorus]